jgi:hypothetical protein
MQWNTKTAIKTNDVDPKYIKMHKIEKYITK